MKIFAVLLAVLVVLIGGLKLANPLPPLTTRPADRRLPDTQSALAQTSAAFVADHQGRTGLYLLTHGIDAFATRMAMARAARTSIDAQYYIWEGDLTGRMLLAELIAAADRGVRVRLLLDDNPTAGLDPIWAGVMTHPNIAVRLFNPLTIRRVRAANYLFDFARLNRRMHNKSFTVDGAVTLVGGRNVGDAYFGARDEGLFIDVDALAVGAIVPDVAAEFERYWTSNSAHAAQAILKGRTPAPLAELRNPAPADPALAASYQAATDAAMQTLRFGDRSAFFWTDTRLVADDPAKAEGKGSRSDLLAAQIAPLFRGAKSRIDLVSGYFVPARAGTALLAERARQGVRVRAVTNSIQVTDVPVVHAGYAPYRPALLAAGVELFEARPFSDQDTTARRFGQTRFSGGGESVHAKTFAIDGRYFFVGSFNLDPRSALLNCEMGFVVDSPELAQAFIRVLDDRLAEKAYALATDGKQKIVWEFQRNGQAVSTTVEPGTTPLSRALVSLLSILPIEWML